MPEFDRKKLKEEMFKRTQESQERTGGEAILRYFKPDSDLPFWKPLPTKADPHMIDIIPFMCGDKVPKIENQNFKKGTWVYVIESWVHTNVGPGKAQVLCPAKNYGNPCPICEAFEKQQKETDEWDVLKHFYPSRRCAYNIWVKDNGKQEKKGVQIWEVSRKYSEAIIKELVKNPRKGGVVSFTDPDEGMSLSFSVADDKYRTNQGHKFIERDYKVPLEIINSTYVLDDHFLIMSYEQIAQLFYGDDEKPEAQEENPIEPRRNKAKPAEEKQGCDFGGTWGVDCDELEVCLKECPEDVYEKCGMEKDRYLAELEKKAKEEAEQAAQEEAVKPKVQRGTRKRS